MTNTFYKNKKSAVLILCVFVACFALVFCCKWLKCDWKHFNGNAFEVRWWKVWSTCVSHAVKDTFEML